jgi:hypothetical protein
MVGSNRHKRSKMSEMDPKDTKAAPAESFGTKNFRAKLDDSNELTLDETMAKIAELYRQFAPLKAQLENLKVVAKTHLKAKGLKTYQAADGVKALFYDTNKSEINKTLAKEICGARWAEVESFKTITSFKVTVPGVKSPDAD